MIKTNQILTLLKKKHFLPLFVTQFLGAFNDNVFKNALVILITYQLANLVELNPQILVTLAGGIFILPFFLFSATAGQLADKYEKSRLISIIKFIEIILMGLATFGFIYQSVSALMTVLFLLGTHAAFFGPLKYSILPEHLRENELIAGNGLIEAGTFLSILLGTIFGGVLILSQNGIYIISVLLFSVALIGWIASLFIPLTEINPNKKIKISLNIFKETFALIQYSKNRWDIYLSILGISWFWLVGAIFLSEFPVLAKDVLFANQSIVTLFLAIFSIGLGIGSLLCNKLLKGKVNATYVPLGALGMTLFIFDLYFATKNIIPAYSELIGLSQFMASVTGVRVCIDLLIIAICGGIYSVPLYAILQNRSEKEHCARVIASNNVINAFFMVIAAVLTTILLKVGFTVTQIFLILAFGNAIVAIYICKLLPDLLVKSFFRSLLTFFYRVKVQGLENYQAAGKRIIIIANHTSFMDALLLATFLPDKLTFAINTTTAKKWWIKLFLSLVNSFSIDPSKPMALKSLIEFVKKDKRCVIFPEGRLTVTGALMKIYEGPGLVADKSNAKLLPIRIQGAELTPFSRLRGKVRIRLMPTITITIFPAEQMAIDETMKGRKRRQEIGYKLYDVMTKMMFESSNYQQTLFASLLDAKAAHGSHYPILEDIERTPVTYKQFITRCYILGGIIAKSTKPHENVGILLPNMASTITTFFALHAYSRVPTMINYSTGIHNVVSTCQTAEVKIIYTSARFIKLAKLKEMVSALKEAGITIVYLEELRSKVNIFTKLKGVLMGHFPRLSYKWINSKIPQSYLHHDAPAVILFTSGSEGSPKGVVLSHANIQANRYQLSACIDFGRHDQIFNALPIFHSFGLTGGALLPLLSGIKVFFYPSPLHYRIIPELVYDTNTTILFGTDTFLANYAKYAHAYDFYSVRYIFAGAEKLREETRTLWSEKFGIRIFEGYGATESAPVISINLPMQYKAGSVGRILPGLEYQIKPVPGIEEGGVLTIKGPNVMKGYLLADQPGTLVPPTDGWYDTGDIVSIDAAGFLTIIGRAKRFAKIAGEMVSLTTVEQQINKLWPDHQHAVINIPDAKKGEQLLLITTNSDATREEVVNFVKQNKMGEISIPKKIMTLAKLPLLATGKVDYPGLRGLLEEAS